MKCTRIKDKAKKDIVFTELVLPSVLQCFGEGGSEFPFPNLQRLVLPQVCLSCIVGIGIVFVFLWWHFTPLSPRSLCFKNKGNCF